jgi:hypothetical protein
MAGHCEDVGGCVLLGKGAECRAGSRGGMLDDKGTL